MNYEEQVKALRHCMTKEDGITICEPCPYYGKGIDCEDVLHTDAAAAIEELQAELEKKRTADCWGCKCEKLEPKRGKWIYDGKFVELNKFYCSKCKRTEFRMSDFCPNCGADMRDTEADNG